MEDFGLDLHNSLLLSEYREKLPIYNELHNVVMKLLKERVASSEIQLNSIEARIKSENSFVGKLLRKGHKYSSISDITDIFGARIITFYNEDVDRIASMVESIFEVDWPNSVDKRKMHQFDSFGYNSLHYICRLPRNVYYNPQYSELNSLSFELQMRTALQHVWSAIQHDIGYKSVIETPMEYHRSLSRLAGLLELADDEFSRIRTSVNDYRRRAQSLVSNGKFEKVLLDADTFKSYLDLQPFSKLNKKIASITQAELQPAPMEFYVKVLRLLGMETLADVEHMLAQNFDDAYQLALFQLGSTDIDIITDAVGLQNLCIVQILKNGSGVVGLKKMFDILNGHSATNSIMAELTLKQASRLPFMHTITENAEKKRP